ncbi:MAG TPA: peptide chain release factor N(5)-glutamine methyltransferase [Allosphingosinicella sp.]|nr:peptide chain release factor N(5)-glutamine methyltransferase [Allosphingosinicella sp.]
MSKADTVRRALADAEKRLAAIPGSPRHDAAILMAAALDMPMAQMLLSYLDTYAPARFEELVRRRLTREPMGYVVGRVGFWTIDLDVGPGALIPRADTESLIDAAVAHFGERAPARILDLGTGPGTLLLAALDQWPEARGLGIDASEDALAWARGNAARLDLADRADWRRGNWADGIEGPFELILCNPPYVEAGADLPPDVSRFEPASALYAGADGLDAYRALAPQLARLLAPGGVTCLEMGAGQEKAVADLFAREHFTIESRRDLRGIARCLVLTR